MSAQIFSNTSVKNKLLFIVLIPILALLILSGMKVCALHEWAIEQSNLVELMDISVAASDLVHELQAERGASAGFINSKGKAFANDLSKQRLNTDRKRKEFEAVLNRVNTERFGEAYNKRLVFALGLLKDIKTKRGKISQLKLPLKEVVDYYTKTTSQFLNVTEQSFFAVKDAEILRDLSAYLYFMQSKERAGIERAVGASGFGGGWDGYLRVRFNNFIVVQDTYMDVSLTYATDEERAFYHKRIDDPSFAAVDRMRDIALGRIETADEITAEIWFKAITKKINILKEIEDHFSADIKHLAHDEFVDAIAQRNFYIIILGAMFIVIALLTRFILKDFLGNIRGTIVVMEELSRGNSAATVLGMDRKDEFGEMARSIEVLKQGLIEKSAMEEQALATQARAEEQSRQMMSGLAEGFDEQVGGLIGSLASASTELQASAESMRDIANETAQSSQTVATSSETANSNVNNVAAAMEEMAAASSEIAMQISNAQTQSNETAKSATNASQTVEALNALVENIGEVVSSIQDIAEQTNLLALNATIEAARAGDAGKGFAVVADEVKKLATETGSKTLEIRGRIAEIQEATHNSVQAMEGIIVNIAEIDQSVTGVSAAIEEQNATNGEIVRSVAEASQGVSQVSQIIVEVQKSAERTGGAAGDMLGAATEVSKLSETLKSSVDKFLGDIRNGNSSGEGSIAAEE